MIAVDTNLLVYSAREDMPDHAGAAATISDLHDRGVRWAIPWPCVHEYLAVVTNPRIFRTPTPMGTAVADVAALAASPTVSLLAEAADHLEQVADLLASSGVGGPRVHDARIAAICLGHGVSELWTADRDFGRFPQLRTHNPLVEGNRS